MIQDEEMLQMLHKWIIELIKRQMYQSRGGDKTILDIIPSDVCNVYCRASAHCDDAAGKPSVTRYTDINPVYWNILIFQGTTKQEYFELGKKQKDL